MAKNIEVQPGRKSPAKDRGYITPQSDSSNEEKGNIRVFVRVRPLSKEEIDRGEKSCVQVLEDQTQFIKVVDYGYGYNSLTRKFQFDGCLSHEVRQDEIMERCEVQKLLDCVLDGYSSAVIACGQTGSGKTYTMCGRNEEKSSHEDGLIAQCVESIFTTMKLHSIGSSKRTYSLRASYYEVYNEQSMVKLTSPSLSSGVMSCKTLWFCANKVNDLLRLDCAPRDVKWCVKDGYYVDNLLLVDCESVDDVFSVLNEGARNRKVGSHDLNKDSSRSHCIMTLHVDSITEIDGGPPIVRYGKMLFVDLAGSERLKKSRSSGDMLKETGNINRSLFTLGKVISALAEGKKGDLVPYRESMLTKLLMESLGGNSLALMIACISPASSVVEETLSTLYYATCTKTIVNAPSVNIDERDKVIVNLHKEIDQLKEENRLLRSKLGLPSEGDISSNALLKANMDTNPSGSSPLQFASFLRTAAPAAGEEFVNSNRSGWMLDKERMLTQLRTAERLLCKKMPPNALDNLQDNLPHASVWQPEPEASMIEEIENLPRTNSLLSAQPLSAYSEGSFKSKSLDHNTISRGKSDDTYGSAHPRKLQLGKQRGLAATYQGLDANKLFNRRNRVSVDHLSSRLRSKSLPRGTSCRGGLKDHEFQGSITVNQNAFLRLLDIGVSEQDGSNI